MRRNTLGVLVVAGCAGVAWSAQPAAAGMEFDGFYVGGAISAVYSTLDTERDDTGQTNDYSDVGVDGRAFGGFGKRFDRFYVGAEADIGTDFNEVEYSQTLPAEVGGVGRDQQVTTTVETDFYAGFDVILGYLIAENTLLYGRGGYEFAPGTVEAEFEGAGKASVDRDFQGFRAGVGLEVGITDNISTRLEYRGSFYGDDDITYTSTVDPSLVVNETINLDRHVFGVAASYRF